MNNPYEHEGFLVLDYGPCDGIACAFHRPSDKHLTCKRIRNPSEDSSVVMAYIFWQECNNSVEYVAITEDESSRLLLLPHMQVARVTTSAASTGRTGVDQPVVGKGG